MTGLLTGREAEETDNKIGPRTDINTEKNEKEAEAPEQDKNIEVNTAESYDKPSTFYEISFLNNICRVIIPLAHEQGSKLRVLINMAVSYFDINMEAIAEARVIDVASNLILSNDYELRKGAQYFLGFLRANSTQKQELEQAIRVFGALSLEKYRNSDQIGYLGSSAILSVQCWTAAEYLKGLVILRPTLIWRQAPAFILTHVAQSCAKPYKCEACGKGFRRRVLLNTHSSQCPYFVSLLGRLQWENYHRLLASNPLHNQHNGLLNLNNQLQPIKSRREETLNFLVQGRVTSGPCSLKREPSTSKLLNDGIRQIITSKDVIISDSKVLKALALLDSCTQMSETGLKVCVVICKEILRNCGIISQLKAAQLE